MKPVSVKLALSLGLILASLTACRDEHPGDPGRYPSTHDRHDRNDRNDRDHHDDGDHRDRHD